HTRSKRDWSSDVCSSDLFVTLAGSADKVLTGKLNNAGTVIEKDSGRLVLDGTATLNNQAGGVHDFQSDAGMSPTTSAGLKLVNRSEERRVGKECRSGW